MPETKGEILINALQKQTNKQNATLLYLQYLLAKIFFQNRSYAHMVDILTFFCLHSN